MLKFGNHYVRKFGCKWGEKVKNVQRCSSRSQEALKREKLKAAGEGWPCSYRFLDHLDFFAFDKWFHVMEKEHGQEFRPQPLLGCASNYGGLCQGDDSEGGVDGEDGSKRETKFKT